MSKLRAAIHSVVLTLAILTAQLPAAEAATPSSCSSAFAGDNRLQIMLEGSLNVSRTKVVGRRFIAPKDVADHSIAEIAEGNFDKAARLVVENYETLELNLETAVRLNTILTDRLVPAADAGKYKYRPHSSYSHVVDQQFRDSPLGSIDAFYVWLSSDLGKALHRKDPVRYAEIIHNTIAAHDSFPDGNGRLSRLFADLALLKAGLPPAYYTSMPDYFSRGNARSEVSRETKLAYFREIVQRAQVRLHKQAN